MNWNDADGGLFPGMRSCRWKVSLEYVIYGAILEMDGRPNRGQSSQLSKAAGPTQESVDAPDLSQYRDISYASIMNLNRLIIN